MSRGHEVLVAEDDPVIRRAVKASLASEGYSVRETPDGASALRAFGEKRPDLVLLDVMMPATDGFEVCARIRAVDARVPIIFLTARSSDSASASFSPALPLFCAGRIRALPRQFRLELCI